MPNLKDLRTRKKSVQSTKKITAAMKMIAAAKLKKAQEKAQAARPYAQMMTRMLDDIIGNRADIHDLPELIIGHSHAHKHLVILLTSDRGLCGGFNTGLVKQTRLLLEDYLKRGLDIKIMCMGRKGEEQLKREYGQLITDVIRAQDLPRYYHADRMAQLLLEQFDNQTFDVCTIVYNHFISALKNEVTVQQLIPFKTGQTNKSLEVSSTSSAIAYEYEPSKKQVLTQLARKNLSVQIFRAMLETAASEHGARMAAMDSATRNASEMIRDLELRYNRTRQALITNELIEIISGAQAL